MNTKRGSIGGCVLCILIFSAYSLGQNLTAAQNAKDDHLQYASSNFTSISASYGYISEEHTVTTEDGYILTMFRIPKGKRCLGSVRQPPVLLMHGFLLNSDSWTDAGPTASLAYLLPDACYDLWLGNVRGTDYGRRHERLDPDTDSEFWNFTSNEMGKYDIPSFIDYILNRTSSTELIYVGYSQGARILLIMCSETVYCNKIKLFISLAPAVRLRYTRSLPFRLLVNFYELILPLLTNPNELEVLPKGGLIQSLAAYFCRDYIAAATICKLALNLIDSYDPLSVLTQTARVLFGHTPAGSSARNVAFYSQSFAQTFNKYDYGADKNLEIYGSVEPPQYALNRTTIPVVLIYGKNDYLVDTKDVMWLSTQLPNVLETYQVRRPTWNHLDYTYSQFTPLQIFPKINKYFLKYTDKVLSSNG
ncbi:lipase 3 [Papilio machaon]|uniref:lipase 3 n=1 Tax=Papilio machaon TaxID=76193 RepID=UPI001E663616|nr:lipase 3 [Papilio machaon]